MSKRENLTDLPLTFVDLKGDEQAPRIAAYEVDRSGRPVKKLGCQEGSEHSHLQPEGACLC